MRIRTAVPLALAALALAACSDFPTSSTTTSSTTTTTAAGTIAEDAGTLIVGRDVKAGTYRATVPGDSFGCYWARLKGTSGATGDIITNGLAKAAAHVVVTIAATDKAFESNGCGPWTLSR